MRLRPDRTVKRLTLAATLLVASAVPAFADYNCNVYLSANRPDNGGVWSYDVPDFRTSGWLGIRQSGYSYGDIFYEYYNKMDKLFHSRTATCAVRVSQQKFGTAEKVEAFLNDYLDVANNVNAKTLYCTRQNYFEVGGKVANGGVRVNFNTQKVANRRAWADFSGVVKPSKQYCRSYYPAGCFDASLASTDTGGLEPLGPDVADDIDDMLEDVDPETHQAEAWEQAQENATNTEPTYPEGYVEPPDYCEPLPFELILPDRLWTVDKYPAPYPVDINGDGYSDVLQRHRSGRDGIVLRSQLSNADGTFTAVDYVSGETFMDTWGALPGYFDANGTTDIVLRNREPGVGMVFHTKLSNADGTFDAVRHVDGDEAQKRSRYAAPAMVGDVDGDRLSDIVVSYRSSAGLELGVKFSNGDGTFRAASQTFMEGTFPAARLHLADVNKDRKSDVLQTYMGANGLEIRSYLSKGDGTFSRKIHRTGVWFNVDSFQSFVADVNRDKRTDVILLHRTPAGDLFANTYIGRGDGTFQAHDFLVSEGDAVNKYDAFVTDMNGDVRSDILLLKRDSHLGLVLVSVNSKGDGQYTVVEHATGDGSLVDEAALLIGNHDRGSASDLGLLYTDQTGQQIMRTKLGSRTVMGGREHVFGLPPAAVPLDAISGAMRWSGGGTFNPTRTGSGGLTLEKAAAKPAPLKTDGSGVLRPAETTTRANKARARTRTKAVVDGSDKTKD